MATVSEAETEKETSWRTVREWLPLWWMRVRERASRTVGLTAGAGESRLVGDEDIEAEMDERLDCGMGNECRSMGAGWRWRKWFEEKGGDFGRQPDGGLWG